MNAEYINAFIQGAQATSATITGEMPKLGKVFIKNRKHKFDSVLVYISIVGNIEAYMIFNTDHNSGLKIVSKMVSGMDVGEWDEMSKSAISELCNMISGNICTMFSGLGKIVDITPPTFLYKPEISDMKFIKENSTIICIPLLFQDGTKFEIDVLMIKE